MNDSQNFLPYGIQSVDEDDISAVAEVLRSDWLTTGPMVTEFEYAFANKVGAPHAVACSSGTAALHLAAVALGLAPTAGYLEAVHLSASCSFGRAGSGGAVLPAEFASASASLLRR